MNQRACAEGSHGQANEGVGLSVLSPRELEVDSHLALVPCNALIGAHMGLAESTVTSYLAPAARKLVATNRFDAVLRARHSGLIA
ncbi:MULTISPECIES: LuxR C-terminal-related transcriptional regulator [Glutamicibacter]|uniref:LuxR C-terminal-related transcriptional regulator n=1 Tax=Glutamicibacter TaxID=1742989 RepID=UPI0005790BB6|nr:LuxR C-terminal-related transcriptional regulator [Glutamicibacter mysorens]KWR70836.1 hypothetical protein RN04_11530 [Arthrobacter sp. W1]UTM46538.1 LuxR C-terminal-related transcriptional regulator [Glutamicibacter mysorens]